MKDPRKTNQAKLKSSTVDPDSPEYKDYIAQLPDMAPEARSYGEKIAEMARNGRIRPEVLRKIRETLLDPNKMEKEEIDGKKPYHFFMKALTQGKFHDNAKRSLGFLRSLEGGEKEKEYAVDLLKDLSGTRLLSDREEQEALKKLSDLREEDLEQQAIAETSTAAKSVTEIADIKNRVEKAAKTTPDHWTVEAAPESLVGILDTMEIKLGELTESANKTLRELDREKVALKPNENKIEELHQKLAALDREIHVLNARLIKPRLQYTNWLERNLARFRALNTFFKRAGVDVRTAERLRMWFLDLSSGKVKEGEKASLKLMGMEIDPVSGKTKKKEGYIKITGLSFATDDRKGIEADASGELIIEYTDEAGVEKKEGYKNFLQLLTVFEGYEEIDSLDDLNKRSAEEFGCADLAVGQEFMTNVLVGFDKEGKEINERHSFKIENIDTGKKTVTIDRTVTKIPRQWIEFSVDDSLYFDRKQREFSFGEFAKFLKQHNYEREVHIDETQTICDKTRALEEVKSKDFISGASPKSKERYTRLTSEGMPKVDLPKKEGETREVLFIDSDELLRWGKLSREKGPNGLEHYVLRERVRYFRNGDATITNLIEEAGVPQDFAYTHRPSKLSFWTEGGDDATKILRPMEIARMVRDGSITNAPSTRPTKDGKWTCVKNPDEKAALEIDSKNIFAEEAEEEEAAEAAAKAAAAGAGAGAVAHTPGHPAEAHAAAHDAHAAHGAHDEHGAHGEHGGHEEHGEHGAHEEHGAHGEHDEKKFYEEALPIDQVKKIGGMTRPEKNYLRALWTNTRFLSMNDCWKMGKSMWEYYDRRWERRQKDKFARVGEELPYFSPEMRRIVEATEHEEVHQYQEAFEHKGIYEIQYRLEHTSNKDELKATLATLTDKGQMRWDSIPLWNNINKFVAQGKEIPIPANGDPNTIMSKVDNRTGFSYLMPAIDSIWGEGTYNGFYSKNKSAYSSNSKSFYEEGKELEGVDGGHARRLAILLQQHKQGGYVNPHEYEGLILHAIEAGKSSMQAKIYYMIEGVAAQNHSGRTILPYDRIAHINSEMLTQFPILEYITAKVPRPPSGEKSRFTLDDYKSWAKMFDKDDPDNCKPSVRVDEFMWNYVIPSDETENRINKALRNGEKLDHDDMFAYLPPADTRVITDACKAIGGAKKFLTIEGYANVFPGFSQYMRSLAGMGRKEKLRQAIESYVRYEGIMTSRFAKVPDKQDPYQRMDSHTLNSATIVSDTPPQAFIDQINPAIQAIAAAYEDKTLIDMVKRMYDPEVINIYTADGKEKQKVKDFDFEQFNDVFDRVIKTDNGAKMQDIILGANFEGMPAGQSDEEVAMRRATFVNKNALD